MQIDPTDNLIFNRPVDTSKRPDPANKRTDADSADAGLKTEYASIIRQAIESDKTDPAIIQQAKQDLDSGQLDSAAAAEAAAQNILKFGI